MKTLNPFARRVSRRTFMKSSAGALVASSVSAPAVLAQANKPIRLGNLNTYTGGLAYAGEAAWNATNLYFDSINWTVAGRKIEIIKEDDQFNPQIGLQKAKKLIESDQVDLLFGIQASNVALAVLNYMKQQKAFYMVTGAGTDAITWDRYPYLFRTSISTYQLSTPMATYIYDNLGKEIVTTASDYAGGRDVMAQFKGPYRGQRRQGAQGNLAAARHHRFQPVPDRHQVDQSAGHVRFHAGRRRVSLRPAIFRVRPEGENAADRIHDDRLAIDQFAGQSGGRRDLGADLRRYARQSGGQGLHRGLPRQIQIFA